MRVISSSLFFVFEPFRKAITYGVTSYVGCANEFTRSESNKSTFRNLHLLEGQ